MNLQPLRLEWTLVTPLVVSSNPLHLDALLAYAVTEEALRGGAETSGAIRDLADDLPLERAEYKQLWCWKASALQNSGGPHAMRYWTRKTDSLDFSMRMEGGQIEGRFKLPLKAYALKIDTQRGLMKQQFKFFPVQQVTKVFAWCLGDLDRIEELLHPDSGLVTHLGPKSRMGYGRIGKFRVAVDEEANNRWSERVMPWKVDGTIPVRLAAHPPYWDVENIVDAYINPNLLGK